MEPPMPIYEDATINANADVWCVCEELEWVGSNAPHNLEMMPL